MSSLTKNQLHYRLKQKPQRQQDKYNREVLIPELKSTNLYLESQVEILREKVEELLRQNAAMKNHILSMNSSRKY